MATVGKYQTASGATLFRVRYRTPDGQQTDKRGFETAHDAKAFAASVEVAKMRGEYVSPSAGKVTIGELAQPWLDRQRGHMKPSGFRGYESAWKIHVGPRWATVRIENVRFSDVQAWVGELAAQRGPSIVRTAYGVLTRILEDRVRDNLLPSNPARGVKLPKKAPQKHVYLTAGQLGALADQAGSYRGLVLLLGVGGLRWGEAAALTVGDVNFLRRRVSLHRNAVMVADRVIVGSLKGNKNRTVALPAFVIDALAETCRGKARDELLWATAAGGFMGPPGSTTSWLATAVRRCMAGDPTFPRVTSHALRHTAASLAISAGTNVKVIQRMLGHASAAMTLDTYADLFESDLDAAAENVGKLWAQEAGSH